MKRIVGLSWKMVTIELLLFTVSVYAAPLDDEAKKIVTDYFKKIGVICGDSFYIAATLPENVWGVKQTKEFSFNVKQQQVSYADKLNGVEWKGYGILNSKATRAYVSVHGWSPWVDGQEEDFLTLIKEKGKWAVNLSSEGRKEFFKNLRHIDCKQIEALPK